MMKNVYNYMKYDNQQLIWFIYISYYITTIYFISIKIALNSNEYIFINKIDKITK